MTEVVERARRLPDGGLDVVEVSPPYDHAGVTAYLANRVVLGVLSGLAWRRQAAAGGEEADVARARGAPARASPGRRGPARGRPLAERVTVPAGAGSAPR